MTAPELPAAALASTVTTAPPVASPPAATKVPELTLEQYAALYVAIQANPDRFGQILQRYQLSPEAKDTLDARWRARFAADHGLYTTFTRAYSAQQASLMAAVAPPAAAPGGGTRAIDPPAVSLSVEQYAALCAELSAAPARTPEIRARYGIWGDAAWATVNRHWEIQLNRDAALRARWITLVREIGSASPRRG